MVKGLRIEFKEDVVAKVIGLPQEGENWAKYSEREVHQLMLVCYRRIWL